MISDVDLMVNKYISVPKDMGGLNCAAFVAGIVKGALDNAGFPARSVNVLSPFLPKVKRAQTCRQWSHKPSTYMKSPCSNRQLTVS